MLEKLKSVNIKGGFFEEEKNIELFKNEQDRVSFIYGRNGSGKTSISNAFLALKDNNYNTYNVVDLKDFNSTSVSISEDKKKYLYVFNEKFIDEKIKFSHDGMNTIVMFGKQIEIEDELKSKTEELEDLEKKYQEIKIKNDNYENIKNSKSPLYYKELILNQLKSDTGWAAREQKIKQLARKSSVSDNIFETIISAPYKKDIKNEIKKLEDNTRFLIAVSSNTIKYPIVEFDYLIDKDYDDKLKNVLLRKIEKPKLTKREKIIFDLMKNGYQSNIEAAKSYFDNDVSFCPYCFQAINDEYRKSLIEEFKTVLNDKVTEHSNELNQYKLSEITFDISHYSNLNAKLCEDISNEIKIVNNHIKYLNDNIEAKEKNIYLPIALLDINLENLVSSLCDKIKKLSDEVVEYNKKVDNKKKTEQECQELNIVISRNEIDSLLKTYNSLIVEKDNNIKEMQKIIEMVKSLRIRVNELKNRKMNFDIALRKINNDLAYIFFSKDRLSVECIDSKYVVLSYGKKVELNKLSVGERNAIALCYFFAQVLENTDETNDYSNDFFLIIDDPVSSFDFENKIGVFSFIRSKLNKILNNNNKNKVIIFTHEIEAMIHFDKLVSEFKSFKFSFFTLLDKQTKQFEKFDKNGYTQAFITMYNYALTADDKDDLIIGNNMRKVLEAFSTFQCKLDIETFMRDEDILSVIPKKLRNYFENFMYRLVLNGESHYSNQAITYPEGNFYNLISKSEKQITAKNLLAFLYMINPIHVKKQLGGNNNYISNVKAWAKNLEDNYSD